jgi:deoxyribodipyrimidine photo-lyase
MPDVRALPVPPTAPDAAVAWVGEHLADVVAASDAPLVASGRFRGGQRAADAALADGFHGYAARRNEVWPVERRGATGLSPYIRHGLLDLPHVWEAAGDAPGADRDKLRDELLWQEYGRHLYARLGPRTGEALRHAQPEGRDGGRWDSDPWQEGRELGMACLTLVLDELAADGWAVNQTRMWLASHWAVRGGADWRAGEDALYRVLIDGSRAANRLGWQWTAGTGTGRPYLFGRAQVERRAPGLCATCPLASACPIEQGPALADPGPVEAEPLLRDDPDPAWTAGPLVMERRGDQEPAAVWLTAESLGDADPALAAHPELPAVFVFDTPLLRQLMLAPLRLVFLAETLGELAERRPLQVWRGATVTVLTTHVAAPLATTFAPVPGWRRRAAGAPVVAVHPWRWLRRPAGGRIGSFSAWRPAPRR